MRDNLDEIVSQWWERANPGADCSQQVRDLLRNGLNDEDLCLAYQPIVACGTAAVVGAEALLRWRPMAETNSIPTPFIREIEGTGQVNRIGLWVLEQVCRDVGSWQDQQLIGDDFRVWVNVSPTQLANPGFGIFVSDLCALHQISPTHIGFELLEQPLVHTELAAATLGVLRTMGFGVHLDDFGVAQSNLIRLVELPITGVKIDRQLIAALGDPSESMSLVVKAVINLAHELGLEVIAEGVESAESLQAIEELGCDYAQGFQFGVPVHASQFEIRYFGGQDDKERATTR